MEKVLFYSHDSYGLGNIRRTLSICRALTDFFPNLSILIITGSPMIYLFSLPERVEFIKLPCPTRLGNIVNGSAIAKNMVKEVRNLRSDMILCATKCFKPDLILVNRRPKGVKGELNLTLSYVRSQLPNTRIALLLRDILDAPKETREDWENLGWHPAIREHYDLIFVLGLAHIFDPIKEYHFPPETAEKVRFCGYIQREKKPVQREAFRQTLGLSPNDRLVLITAGGGGDGFRLIQTYLSGLAEFPLSSRVKNYFIPGPEMPESHLELIRKTVAQCPHTHLIEFTRDLMTYMEAADLVVGMGGYGTICEILTLKKTAIIVPRGRPLQEQIIRATIMDRQGILQMIHPDHLTPKVLIRTVQETLLSGADHSHEIDQIDTFALQNITYYVSLLLNHKDFANNKQNGYRPRSGHLPIDVDFLKQIEGLVGDVCDSRSPSM